MRLGLLIGFALTACIACGSAPAHPAMQADAPETDAGAENEPAAQEPEPAPSNVPVDRPELSRPPSTATYEEAMSTPENLDVNDSRPHLTDDQLRAPMRNAFTKCAVPKNAKVTIHTAVQSGRAIGVTVEVRIERPPVKGKPKPIPRAVAQREAKTKKRIADCVDKNVRALIWPPSSRRDSFTTEL